MCFDTYEEKAFRTRLAASRRRGRFERFDPLVRRLAQSDLAEERAARWLLLVVQAIAEQSVTPGVLSAIEDPSSHSHPWLILAQKSRFAN